MSLTDKFDRNRKIGKNKVGSDNISEQGDIEYFAKAGPMRFISFVMADGRREFFSYADLSRCSFYPEESKIVLNFRGSGSVTLKGQNMESLYERLQNQFPRKILCIDTRYRDLQSKNATYVTEMFVEKL